MEDLIWEHVLPKEGKEKYSWIDFSKYHPHFNHPYVSHKHSVDNKPDLQPPEEVITQSGGEDPPKEVLSPSDEWEEGERVCHIYGTMEKVTQYTGSLKQRYCVIMIRMVWRHTQGTLTQMSQVHN